MPTRSRSPLDRPRGTIARPNSPHRTRSGCRMNEFNFEFCRAVLFGLANFSLGLTFGLWFAERRMLRRVLVEREDRRG